MLDENHEGSKITKNTKSLIGPVNFATFVVT